MGLKQELEKALHQAMRENDIASKRTIRLIMSNIKLSEIENRNPLDDAKITTLLQKEIKTKQESIADAKKGNRTDIISENEQDIEIIKKFLPKQLSDDEIETLVKSVIEELGATGMADMSNVIKNVLKRVQGSASGEKVSFFVKQELAKK
jgi:uncharacterized protein